MVKLLCDKFHSMFVLLRWFNRVRSCFSYPYTAFYGYQTSVVWLQSSYQNRFISKSVISMQVVMETQLKLVQQLWNLKITLNILLLCIISRPTLPHRQQSWQAAQEWDTVLSGLYSVHVCLSGGETSRQQMVNIVSKNVSNMSERKSTATAQKISNSSCSILNYELP